MLHKTKNMLIAGLSAIIIFSTQVQAVTPSPQMIEQFKQLPKSEQERIAKQYGVDPSMLSASSATTTVSNPQVVKPRSKVNNVLDQSEDEALTQQTKTAAKVDAIDNKKEQQLKPFGYDLFAGSPTTFAPVSDVPVPSEYMVGPGDTINVQLYGKENNNYQLMVGRDGAVQFPDLGPISLVGLSFAEARSLLQDKIAQSMIGINANITMGELRSIRIFVAGDAYQPGSYTVSSLSTITQALFISGGINQIGSLRNIQLKRQGKTVGSLDLYDLLMRGDASGDIRLQSGDVVFIPSTGGTVSVMGEVRRPAIYELKNNETMADIIKMASGLNPGAFPKASVVERFSDKAVKTVINVDLTAQNGLNQAVKNGDVLNVKSASNRIDNAITIAGAVIRPGKYQWTKQIKVADLLPSIWGNLTISADLDYALLVREINQRGDIEVHRIALGKAITEPFSEFNLTLKPRDTVLVFDYDDRKQLLNPIIKQLKKQSRFGEAAKLVSINGNVRFPGQYPLTANGNVKELLIAAGGLEEGSYTMSAELTRQIVSQTDGVSIEHKQLNLNEIMTNPSADARLQSKDILTVRMLPDWQDTRWVKIKGEVKFPGTYSIQRGETLKDVIARAGGYTEDAALKSAVFLRQSVKDKERLELAKLSDELRRDIAAKALTNDSPTVGYADAQLMLKELENIQVAGRLVVDLNALSLGIDEANLDLESEDALYIPPKNQTVSVMGQVQHPSTHRYKEGVTFDQYLELSGGSRKRADDDRIYIIKADGSVAMPNESTWFTSSSLMEPGDTIIVPLDTEYKDSLTLWQQVTSIIYNSAIAAAAVATL
ncbi:sugar transporter [Shewanella algicola]|uniref:SLBB domain-containing protein n=2 Tax=Shewanella algicola TaxID=640633 RepID=A0A9X1ZFR2_9GAMM|nr:SLBB domain-containing protein [Shewanella algicola]MCL1106138.1 SLBB domain-containing protein [Shewanella algicola]GGP57939.1 sugar transporter [Shewanella algicola]